MEAQEKGFFVDEDKVVCTNCFEDAGIRRFIAEHNTKETCSYCAETGNATCSLEQTMEHISSSIKSEWGHPEDEGLPYETREGGWQGPVYDSCELINEIGLEITTTELNEDICRGLGVFESWCERDRLSLTDDETLLYGWRDFSRFVINEARYVFFRASPSFHDPNQHDKMNPVNILDSLDTIVKELGLLNVMKKEKSIKRVRIVGRNEVPVSAKELGSPPYRFAKIPNRMSPAGIPMFYGAYKIETAIAETFDPKKHSGKKAVCGHFFPLRDLSILDLSKDINIPSIFEGSKRRRVLTKFLGGFMDDFTKPIDGEDRSHIDYVPTQIVTEYFRRVFVLEDGKKLDGIVYPSSKDKRHAAIVLFATNDQCVEKTDQHFNDAMLYLEDVTEMLL